MTGTGPDGGATSARWDAHWDGYAVATRANPGQLYRRRLIERLLGPGAAAPGARILDVGCGSGDLLAALAGRFPEARLAGVDQSAAGLAAARLDVPDALLVRCDMIEGTPEELAGWATHAVCSEVLEHLDAPAALLVGAARSLEPGGRLVVTVPGGPLSAFDRHIGHRRHYTRAGIAALLADAGFEVETTLAAGFPAFDLYRLAVILRGRRLIDDVQGRPGPLARLVMAAFRGLMAANLADTPWGWQIAAAARKPG